MSTAPAATAGTARAARGHTELAARRFFWVAACAMAALAATAAVAPLLFPVHPSALGAISWHPTAVGSLVVFGQLLWGARGTWVMLAAGIVVFEIPSLLAGPLTLAGLAGASQSLLIGLVFSVIGSMLLHLSRSADAAADERRAAAATAATAAGARSARARAAALVHDEVLSTLRVAASGLPVERELLTQQARRAQQALSSIVDDPASQAPLIQLLHDEAITIDPVVVFAVPGDDGSRPTGVERELPPAAVHALRSALRQALENSVLHAGAGARRSVSVDQQDATGLRLIISDDGAGFDPQRVPPDRFGLRTSVLEVMRDAGGLAEIRSAPGSGTRITLTWPSHEPLRTTSLHSRAQQSTPTDDPAVLRRSAAIIAFAFTVSQSVLALAATVNADPWWMPILSLGILFTATETLRFSLSERPGPKRTAAVVSLVVLAVFFGLIGAPFHSGDLWFASAAAFALVALSFRVRIVSAAIGGLLVVALVVSAGIAASAPPALIAAMSVRPLGVTVIGALLAASVALLLRRTLAAQLSAEAELEQAAWNLSARAELAERGRETLDLVSEALDTIASGATLTTEFRARAQALDGLLRDRLRAGSLASEPLLSAVMQARGRGVDVVLLDDHEGDLPSSFDLPGALATAAAAVMCATRSATVRLLPAERAQQLSLVVDGELIPVE